MAQAGDEEGIARVSTLAFAPGKDSLTTNLFPARLQPETGDPAMTAYPWRLARKGWWIREGEGIIMVAVDDALDGQIVGFSIWESPREPGTQGPKEPSVPCPGFDAEEYASFRAHMETTIKGWFGEVGLTNMWCEYEYEFESAVDRVLTDARSGLLGCRSSSSAQRPRKDAAAMGSR